MDKMQEFLQLMEAESSSVISQFVMYKCFNGMSFREVRDWLEENGLDRHAMLELRSTEIAIVTPNGVMLQKRIADEGKLGLFGGVLSHEEEPRDGAVREIREKLGVNVDPYSLLFAGYNLHEHTYSNGDKVLFHAYRYVLKIYGIPVVRPDEEASGVEFVTTVKSEIIEHQQQFVGDALSGKFDENR